MLVAKSCPLAHYPQLINVLGKLQNFLLKVINDPAAELRGMNLKHSCLLPEQTPKNQTPTGG